jgi:voltage-gated potassium channel
MIGDWANLDEAGEAVDHKRTEKKHDLRGSRPPPDRCGSERQEVCSVSQWFDEMEERESVSRVAEAVITALAFVFIGLLVAELLLDLGPAWSRRLNLIGLWIWAIFAVDFLVRLAFAEEKGRYIANNPIALLSLFLPALRVLRAAQAARAVRGVRVFRLLAGTNRGRRALQRFASFGGAGYLAALTVVVLLLSTAGIYSLEAEASDATITSAGDALWWSASTLTTLSSDRYPVTSEGRLLGLSVMVYGLAISGYVTALLAVFLLGRSGQRETVDIGTLQEEIAALRRELANRRPADI